MNSRQKKHPDSCLIVPDSPEGSGLGYCSAWFEGHIRRVNRTIYIWKIFSKDPGKGHLSALIQRMLDRGYTVKVPTPIGKMTGIVRHKGFSRTVEFNPELEPYEVWVKKPDPKPATGFKAPLYPARTVPRGRRIRVTRLACF